MLREHTPVRNFVMKFAELLDEVGKRLHVGCVMAAGQDWVEVSLPEHTALEGNIQVRFLPSAITHEVKAGWRSSDRIGLTYSAGGPPEDQFAGLPGLLDPRPASLKIKR
jgi:hypothetical protein